MDIGSTHLIGNGDSEQYPIEKEIELEISVEGQPGEENTHLNEQTSKMSPAGDSDLSHLNENESSLNGVQLLDVKENLSFNKVTLQSRKARNTLEIDELKEGDIEEELALEEFFKLAEPIILEYYEHGDTEEVVVSLNSFVNERLRPYVTSFCIQIAMDHKDSHREMTSVLISDFYGRVVNRRDIEKGFEILFEQMSDLILDVLDAPTIVGNFLARAVADDCIPPKFVTQPRKIETLNHLAIQALTRADNLLNIRRCWAHLDNVWGMGGPLKPVQTISKQIILLLKEYISSRDIKEACRCLNELEVPHFHHELVYESIILTFESLEDTTEEAMCDLLKALDDACIVLPGCMEQGFLRIFNDMPDIILDVPLAYEKLNRFIERCRCAGFISDKVINSMPTQAPKAFKP